MISIVDHHCCMLDWIWNVLHDLVCFDHVCMICLLGLDLACFA